MPGLYGFGTKPFYLERDPETGAFDFSAAAGGNSQKYSSKVKFCFILLLKQINTITPYEVFNFLFLLALSAKIPKLN